ncbi:hypothetical protein [Aquimarina mytili]|uniref:Uncharacterized protein n=1 Tax=Aquimarina mytili TaxID=874423 RepID=A0A937DCL5_9FLAO|nr:hypothetical protein [Aquimarina mytili]MBL0685076.1 hypothetical protein [Aquimarina mytili]
MKKLEDRIIPAMKTGDFSRLLLTDNKYTPSILENPELWVDNATYLDQTFQSIIPEACISEKLRVNQMQVYGYEKYVAFFETIISSECIDENNEFYYGKDRLTFMFSDKNKNEYTSKSYAYETLLKLDGPCFWTHNSGGYREGIRGWIDTFEAQLLLEDLDSVVLNSDFYKNQDKKEEFRKFLENVVRCGYGVLNGGDIRFVKIK